MKESKNKIKKINVIFVAFKIAVLLLSVMAVIFLKKGETGLSLLMSSLVFALLIIEMIFYALRYREKQLIKEKDISTLGEETKDKKSEEK